MKNLPQKHQNIILGIDPGYGITGYAFIRENGNKIEAINYGVITTPAKMEFVDRLKVIAEDLNELIKRYKPDYAGIEKIYFAKNAKTAIDVGQARGAILLTLVQKNIPIVELTPLQVKQGITGYGKAEKRQIQEMVKSILGLKSIPKPDDAADALAIAITAMNSKRLLKLSK